MRLFRTIWNDTNDNWNKIKEKKDDRDKGGLTWIGQDCIRVSNLNQAASILEDALKKDPNDYKAYCALGFLNIEKNDLLQAKYFLKKAQDYTKTTPQKILILFLLSRLYDLNNARDKAERSIRNIIRINPFCAEALYQNILFRFRKGQKAAALQQLVKLIKENREIYIYALIDPELGDFSEIIHPKLKKLLIEAQDEATKIVPEAEKELKKLEKFLGPEEKEVKEARSLCSKIEELSKGESYFAYLDIIHYGKSVVDMGRKSIEVRRRKLAKALRRLEVRLDRCLAFVSNFPYPYILGSVQRQIKHINKEFDKIREMDDPNIPGQFRKVLARVKEHLSQLDQIEFKLKKLDSMGHIILFFTKFFKKSLIFQTINVLIAIIFFPIITHYLSFVLPGLKISPQNIWFFQKSVLVLGGVSGLVLAILSSAKGPVKQ